MPDRHGYTTTMDARDSITGSLAKCYITTQEGNRYNFMQALSLKATLSLKTVSVPILGKVSKEDKVIGWEGKGSAKFHYNTALVRNMLETFNNTYAMPEFTIQVQNEDPGSSVGIQTVILEGCQLKGDVLLTQFDTETEHLTEEIEFSFKNWRCPQKFKDLNGALEGISKSGDSVTPLTSI